MREPAIIIATGMPNAAESRKPHNVANVVGQLMAELIVDGKAQALDIAPLRLGRFQENDPVKTGYAYGVMG